MTEYKNFGQAGAMGDKARSDNNTFVQSTSIDSIDLGKFAMAQVRTEMKKRANPDDAEQDSEIGAIAQAEKAAKSGDQSKALEVLKGAGKWTLEVAKSVAAGIVEANSAHRELNQLFDKTVAAVGKVVPTGWPHTCSSNPQIVNREAIKGLSDVRDRAVFFPIFRRGKSRWVLRGARYANGALDFL